ncbi:histidine triad nucleotide-binding protein [Gammaproteobacteria bacterium LSUCC0057]|uniref:Histidine triad nucleotide-binding protein n=1 Tax=Gammaproteobacteria bacterium LSUCC0057 TaxID=2559237 RepID=A0A4Y8UFR8_9GAMM|nr:histidine triad nucleotide-binding protein [Gammaproteobacteria bacterium LSUCC0057]
MADEKTLFSRIADGDLPAEILHRDEHCFVIKDISPQAPTHLLVIPIKPIPRLVDATLADRALLGHLLWVAGDIAKRAGCGEAFRLVINNGAGAGQTVFHLHLHVLGNTQFNEASLLG